MNSSIAIFQGLLDSLKTAVSRKLMVASTFYYYSEYTKISRMTWILTINTVLIQSTLISQDVFCDYQINLGSTANLNSIFNGGDIQSIW